MPEPSPKLANKGSFRDMVGQFNQAIGQARSVLELMLNVSKTEQAAEFQGALEDVNMHVGAQANVLVVIAASAHFNAWAKQELAQINDAEDYDRKKKLLQDVNSFCRFFGVAFRTSEHSDPHILYVVSSRDKVGRYVLENRRTKKRTGSCKSLAELLPVMFMSAPGWGDTGVPVSPEWCKQVRPHQEESAAKPSAT